MRRIPILYFHSVSPSRNTDWYKSYLSVSTQLFQAIVKYFQRRGYAFLSLEESLEQKHITGKKVCFTFDDGYLDNFVHAFPVMREFGVKGTIFISPSYVDPAEKPRTSTDKGGFLSWAEMREMEKSGLIDIQSHTMTHSKVFSSSEIRDFHNPHADWLYPVTNRYPEKRPFYITDQTVKNLLPYGTPFFKERSAITTRRLSIEPSFEKYCVETLTDCDWENYSRESCFLKVNQRYSDLVKSQTLIQRIESEEEYQLRVRWELKESKRLIEDNLSKELSSVCWPHGDYNQFCIDATRDAGYKYVHAVPGKGPIPSNSFTRIGVMEYPGSTLLSAIRTIAKVEAHRGLFPFSFVSFVHSLAKKIGK